MSLNESAMGAELEKCIDNYKIEKPSDGDSELYKKSLKAAFKNLFDLADICGVEMDGYVNELLMERDQKIHSIHSIFGEK